jgi:predicted PurR-regulated permease PerM
MQTLPTQTSPNWSRRTKRTVALICLLIAGFGLWQVSEILPLILVSVVLAYLLTPLVNFCEVALLRWLPFGRRGFSVAAAFVIVLLIFILILVIVLPVIFNQLEEFGRNIPRFLTAIEKDGERILSQPLAFNNEVILLDGEPIIPLDRLREVTGIESITDLFEAESLDVAQAAQSFIGTFGGLTAPAFSFLGGAFNAAVNISLLFVMIFYLTKDGDKFIARIVEVSPPSYQGDVRRLLYELGLIWNAYLRGQLILCITIGTAVFFAATLLGLPNAPILGLVAGLLEFVPTLGPFLALVLAVLLALISTSTTLPFLSGASFALAVIVVYSIIQNLEAFYIVPRIMGNNLNLHPFVVIVAVIVGASIAGAVGVILAAPSLATARLGAQYIYGKLTERDPFPAHQNMRTTDTMPIVRMARMPIRRLAPLIERLRSQVR